MNIPKNYKYSTSGYSPNVEWKAFYLGNLIGSGVCEHHLDAHDMARVAIADHKAREENLVIVQYRMEPVPVGQ